ncbi:MAG: response regulator [Butyrivibrio sp.]|nr:response regulator [Butyrivibrio sp.]
MKAENRRKYLAFALTACMLAFLLIGGAFFTRYLNSQIFAERTTQLLEITTQVRANLDNALNSHWNYLNAAVNLLEERELESSEQTSELIGELESIIDASSLGSRLILLDSSGNCYDSEKKHGVWSDINTISDGKDRYTFISDSEIYDGSHWAFVKKLPEALVTGADNVAFTHLILLKDVRSFSEYYDSSAYGSRNETYILKSNGTRMHDDTSQNEIIRTYNVLKSLEEMDGQRYTDISTALKKTDTLSANFKKDGLEYYYCITSLDEYDTMLLFLIPSEYVAANTVGMVRAVVRALVLFVVVLLMLLVLAAVAFAQQHSSARLFKQEQINLKHQKEMNQRLEESNSMLASAKETAEQALRIAEEANRAKSSFLSNMSHDIRTPMNAIIGFSTLLTRDAENPEKVREYTKKITSSGQHLLGLINDVLDISKIEAGKTTLNQSEENIVDLIGDLDGIIRPQMKAKGHTFEVLSRDIKHEQVIMDKLRLNQILLNLLSNAVKYTPDGGLVTLTVRELPQTTGAIANYRFTVEDNGYGMSPEYLKTIFDTFTREEDSITNKIQGTGLGMAITKNLIDLMGGTIAVESEKGKGTKFTVDLGLHISEEEMDQSFWANHNITRILAVDDEEVTCRNIQLSMEGTGVTVDYALDGKSTLEKIRQSERENDPYSLVLVDWQMPGMDGIETARRIRGEALEHTPIIILTTYDWSELEDSDAVTAVDAFLAKPFFLTSFRQKVNMVLNREKESGEDREKPDEESVLKGMNILVAEDNEINAEILGELLAMSGADYEICENGRLAVEEFERSEPGKYGLILMDIQMPVMNGYDATRAIRALAHPRARTIPIIAMTANAFAEDVRDALEAGMNAHVAKPVDMSVLEQTVKAVLDGA